MPDHNIDPSFDHLPESRCQELLDQLQRDLEQFGLPPTMHRVGALALGEARPPALLPGLGEGHTQLETNDYESLEVARLLVKQMLDGAEPGTVKLTVVDSELTGAFADFSALGSDLFEQIDPNKISGFIENLKQKITEAINSDRRFGTLANPRQILVLAGEHGLKPEHIDQLNRIISSSLGAEWGSIVALGTQLEPHDLLFNGFPYNLPVIPDSPLERPSVIFDCRTIGEKAQLGGRSPELEDIVPEEMWTESAKDGLVAPIGKSDEGEVAGISFNDKTPHWVVTGATGSGKTVALKAALTSLTQKYSPNEFQFMVLDLKEGVDFNSFAPSQKDPSYHPHTKLIGKNVNKDPEFGISVLKYLSAEIERRAEICKELGVPNYAEMREADPDMTLPRIVTVLDEFQVLLDGPRAAEATKLLEDLGRRGRSFGIHLVLSSQNVSGITALWAKGDALWGNFKGRAAMPNGTLLRGDNQAASELPLHHMVINDNSGHPNNNMVLKVADASSTKKLAGYKHKAYQNRPEYAEGPKVFDADTVPQLEVAKDFSKLKPSTLRPPKILLADEISVEGGSAKIELTQQSGKNVAVVGKRTDEVNRVMHTAAVSLSQQRNPGDAKFSLLCLDQNSANAVETTAETLRAKGHTVEVISPQKAQAFLAETSESIEPGTNQQKYVFVYGAGSNEEAMTKQPDPVVEKYPLSSINTSVGRFGDTKFSKGDTVATPKEGDGKVIKASKHAVAKQDGDNLVVTYTGASGKRSLKDIMTRGPEQGVHVIVSAESGERLTSLVTDGHTPSVNLVGGYVAIGTSPGELSRFTPDESIVTHATSDTGRTNRATFYDNTKRVKPRTVIPYDGPKGLSSSGDDE